MNEWIRAARGVLSIERMEGSVRRALYKPKSRNPVHTASWSLCAAFCRRGYGLGEMGRWGHLVGSGEEMARTVEGKVRSGKSGEAGGWSSRPGSGKTGAADNQAEK